MLKVQPLDLLGLNVAFWSCSFNEARDKKKPSRKKKDIEDYRH
jgi:hypothetical protein